MAVVYHWKHGWIPLDHTAALAKAKGDHKLADKMLADAHSDQAGIHSRQHVAKAALGLHGVPASDRVGALGQLRLAADRHGAQGLLPGHKSPAMHHTMAELDHFSVAELSAALRKLGEPQGNDERRYYNKLTIALAARKRDAARTARKSD